MNRSRIEQLVRIAQREAAKAIKMGNPPFGAVLTDAEGTIIVRAHNTQYSSIDPTAHAEINALREAARRLQTIRFEGLRLFTNAAPCSMCLSACIKANIHHFYYGAPSEAHMDPWLPAEEVAMRARNPIFLYPDILRESCQAQISKARTRTPPED